MFQKYRLAGDSGSKRVRRAVGWIIWIDLQGRWSFRPTRSDSSACTVAWARSVLDSVTRPPRTTLSTGRSKPPFLATPNAINWLWRPISLENGLESSRSDASTLKEAEVVPQDSRKVILTLTRIRIERASGDGSRMIEKRWQERN
jgi:hypothetical protein